MPAGPRSGPAGYGTSALEAWCIAYSKVKSLGATPSQKYLGESFTPYCPYGQS